MKLPAFGVDLVSHCTLDISDRSIRPINMGHFQGSVIDNFFLTNSVIVKKLIFFALNSVIDK